MIVNLLPEELIKQEEKITMPSLDIVFALRFTDCEYWHFVPCMNHLRDTKSEDLQTANITLCLHRSNETCIIFDHFNFNCLTSIVL